MEEVQERSIFNHLRLLSSVTVVAIVVLMALLGYWSFYPYNPIDTYPDPFKIIYPTDGVVTQGGYLTYEFEYDKYSDVLPEIQRQFVDGLIFNVAGSSQPTVTAKGHGTAQVQVYVPETLPPGEYQLKITATYQVNPIRKVQQIDFTEEFKVIAR
jgi:hypothetical protein